MAGKGKPFEKNDPRRGQSSGRPTKTVQWKEAEGILREALPRILLMRKNALQQLLQSNPTGAEMLAAKFLHEHIPQAIERFLGKTPTVLSGAGGKPLVPESSAPVLPPIDFSKMSEEQLDRFIEATASATKAATAKLADAPRGLSHV